MSRLQNVDIAPSAPNRPFRAPINNHEFGGIVIVYGARKARFSTTVQYQHSLTVTFLQFQRLPIQAATKGKSGHYTLSHKAFAVALMKRELLRRNYSSVAGLTLAGVHAPHASGAKEKPRGGGAELTCVNAGSLYGPSGRIWAEGPLLAPPMPSTRPSTSETPPWPSRKSPRDRNASSDLSRSSTRTSADSRDHHGFR